MDTNVDDAAFPLETYTIDRVAHLLGVHRVTVSRLISRGELKAVRLGHRTVRITHQALLDFLKSKEK